jgi:hypothetical protein
MTKLGQGDRCRLVNKRELGIHGIEHIVNREVILYEWSNGGWYFHCVTDPESAKWWAPEMCFQLEQQQERKKTDEMNKGDRCQLYDLDKLRKANLPESALVCNPGQSAQLRRYDRKRVALHYEGDTYRQQWWAPTECLTLMS